MNLLPDRFSRWIAESRRWRLILLVGGLALLGLMMTLLLRVDGRWLPAEVRRLQQEEAYLSSTVDRDVLYEPQDPLRAGFHSRYQDSADAKEWVIVDLGKPFALDRIVLAPTCIRDSNNRLVTGYGLPRHVRIEASDTEDFASPRLLAERQLNASETTGRYPIQFVSHGRRGRFIRVTLSELADKDGQYFASLGELIVISGNRNVAQWRPLKTSSSIETDMRWSVEFLVDEFSILSAPQIATPSSTDGYLVRDTLTLPHEIVVDLGQTYDIDELRLYPAQPKSEPFTPGWGFPARFRVEVSQTADFADPTVLLGFEGFDLRHWTDRPLIIPVGTRPFFTRNQPLFAAAPSESIPEMPVDPVPARFVKVYVSGSDSRLSPPVIALAELQVFAGTENVALGKSVSASETSERWSSSALVDGFNSRWKLIPDYDWLVRIKRRQFDEEALQKIRGELGDTYSQLWRRLAAGGGAAILVIIGSLTWGMTSERSRTKRETKRLRDRIASDLHDDIGSNLGTIRLISQTILMNPNCDDELRQDINEIAKIATETSDSMRDILWLIKPTTMNLDEFVGRLRQTANRMLGHCQLQVDVTENIPAMEVSVAWRRNVFLCYKELLHNLQKHGYPEHVSIWIEYRAPRFQIVITDDGRKFHPATVHRGEGLANIEKRMREIGGHIRFVQQDRRVATLQTKIS
ncbi:histidine kinase [Crateriforma conspicua]|uniref:Sensor histidine kinase LiaS n=1 Tax=Crateriforma conspicua TaxID=2527996 RepID=A0A5C5XY74_9PLAN|nr:histidine kinase [Crateriforma conspicua]TWT68317.1 Sensor histidine kinase LiaS [Crateriforma conspicua]